MGGWSGRNRMVPIGARAVPLFSRTCEKQRSGHEADKTPLEETYHACDDQTVSRVDSERLDEW